MADYLNFKVKKLRRNDVFLVEKNRAHANFMQL
jgi:hypothetical protein